MVKKYPKSTQSNPSCSANLLLRLDLEFLVKVVRAISWIKPPFSMQYILMYYTLPLFHSNEIKLH